MKILEGKLFEIAEVNILWLVVIPVNIGWTREGNNVMGKGIAYKAAQDDPSLPAWYGAMCRQYREETPVMLRGRYILFPTKPLNANEPWLSWMQRASLKLIKKSFKQLHDLKRPDKRSKILVPLVGCGEGKLDPADVLPIARKYWKKCWRLVEEKA